MRLSADDSALVEDSRSRRALLEKAAGNPGERRRALLIDPGLSARGLDDGGFGDEDVAEIKRSVLAARRLLEAAGEREGRSPRRFSGLAAALICFLLLLAPARVERSTGPAGGLLGATGSAAEPAMTHPVVEAIDLPGARTYELADENLSVVLIVDDSFDL